MSRFTSAASPAVSAPQQSSRAQAVKTLTPPSPQLSSDAECAAKHAQRLANRLGDVKRSANGASSEDPAHPTEFMELETQEPDGPDATGLETPKNTTSADTLKRTKAELLRDIYLFKFHPRLRNGDFPSEYDLDVRQDGYPLAVHIASSFEPITSPQEGYQLTNAADHSRGKDSTRWSVLYDVFLCQVPDDNGEEGDDGTSIQSRSSSLGSRETESLARIIGRICNRSTEHKREEKALNWQVDHKSNRLAKVVKRFSSSDIGEPSAATTCPSGDSVGNNDRVRRDPAATLFDRAPLNQVVRQEVSTREGATVYCEPWMRELSERELKRLAPRWAQRQGVYMVVCQQLDPQENLGKYD